jgi:uncharacterized protein YlbG (UPF0298 family)
MRNYSKIYVEIQMIQDSSNNLKENQCCRDSQAAAIKT